jgi:nitrogen-specific signal transduction histidine kinase
MGTVLVFRDLTERHRLQEELLKAQKLETLEAFAGGVAQNFNNVLTTALGYISLAQLNSQEPEGLGKKLEKAKQSCLLGKELSEQFLTFSQGNSPIKETVFISKVIRDSADFVMKGSPVHCHINIPEDLWPIEIDKKQMRLAIRNLINNARRATPEGGTVHVYVTNVTVLPAHRLSIAPGKYVKVSIQDEGPSPSQEALQKMMDPSVMVKEGAHGLEMATACSIIYGHDGCLTAESRPEPGKILHIYLPASEKETVENKYLEGCFPVGKGKVLLMDRQEMVRDAVGRVLHNLGYEVLAASSGAVAVELYRNALQSSEPFDVSRTKNAGLPDVAVEGAAPGGTWRPSAGARPAGSCFHGVETCAPEGYSGSCRGCVAGAPGMCPCDLEGRDAAGASYLFTGHTLGQLQENLEWTDAGSWW